MDRVHETTTCFLVCSGDLVVLDVFTDTSDRVAANHNTQGFSGIVFS